MEHGLAAAAAGDIDNAIAAYSAALALDPLHPIALYDRGNAYRQRAQRALGQAEPGADGAVDQARALDDYDRAVALDPAFAAAYVNRAVVWYELGQFGRAVEDCTVAIGIAPSLAEAWNNRSLAWYRLGDYAKAKADFDQTIRLEQFYGNAMIMRQVSDRAP